MRAALERLPFDLLFYVTSYLCFDDLVALTYTCRQLQAILDEDTLCHRAVQRQFPHADETLRAQAGHISYRDAFRCIRDRRAALSYAQPLSARIVGHGNEFRCCRGVLCILRGDVLHVTTVHGDAREFAIDLSAILAKAPDATSTSESRTSLLSFNDGVVTVHHEKRGGAGINRLYALSIQRGMPDAQRVLQEIPLQSSYKIFARHTSRWLYYGTYSGVGAHGHHEWEIWGIRMNEKPSTCIVPLQLEDFIGSDVGSTIAFEIHHNHFYAVSNQSSFEVEEIDWTSFYVCIRFPLDSPTREAMAVDKRVYRRQHIEGPIHDSWTDLTLQVDETTDTPVIVESRREWEQASSRQMRKFYISRLPWYQDPKEDGDPAPLDPVTAAPPAFPEDDLLVRLLDESNKPNYAPVQQRSSHDMHPEFGTSRSSTRSFLLARTKFRAYNHAHKAFLDLVEDQGCCHCSATRPCLRLRIGSRRVASAQGLLAPHDAPYRYSPIRMWPPPATHCACSARLHAILNPPVPAGLASGRSISGFLDDRSLVYMVGSGRNYGSGAGEKAAMGVIISVNFSRRPGAADTKPAVECAADTDLDPLRWEWEASACRKGTCR